MVAAVLTKSGFSNFGYEKFVVTEKGREFLSLGNDGVEDLMDHRGNISSSRSRYKKMIHKYVIIPKSKEFLQQVTDQFEKEKTACCLLSNKAIANLAVTSRGKLSTDLLFPNAKPKPVKQHGSSITTLEPETSSPSDVHREPNISLDCGSHHRDSDSGMKRSLSSPVSYRANKIVGLSSANQVEQSSLSPVSRIGAHKAILTPAEIFQLQLALRETRSILSAQSGMKPYDVLSTDSVHALSELLPTSVDELKGVAGWDAWKIQTFGQSFCTTIVNFLCTCGKRPLGDSVDCTEGSAASEKPWHEDFCEQDIEAVNKFKTSYSVTLYRPDYNKKKEDYQLQDPAPSQEAVHHQTVGMNIRPGSPPHAIHTVSQSDSATAASTSTSTRGSKDSGQRTMKKKLDFMAQLKSTCNNLLFYVLHI